jgi:hygromycin-B 4-O-kinase
LICEARARRLAVGLAFPDVIDAGQAQSFLSHHFNANASGVALIGAGAWSRCFGFECDGRQLVARFGHHRDDFEKDRRAFAWSSPKLPIPEVHGLGTAYNGFFAISDRAFGRPMESCAALEWERLVPAVADAFEAMRAADISDKPNWGGWDAAGNATIDTWRDVLLLAARDDPEQRTYGWRDKLMANPSAAGTFTWALDLLDEVATNDVPRALTHCDLVNRNVHVDNGSITGIFDWGCSRYADPLYDLAWLQFWEPWHPNLNVALLHEALSERWTNDRQMTFGVIERLLACHLHIALDHLGYGAYRDAWNDVADVESRIRSIVRQTG